MYTEEQMSLSRYVRTSRNNSLTRTQDATHSQAERSWDVRVRYNLPNKTIIEYFCMSPAFQSAFSNHGTSLSLQLPFPVKRTITVLFWAIAQGSHSWCARRIDKLMENLPRMTACVWRMHASSINCPRTILRLWTVKRSFFTHFIIFWT